MKRLLTREEIIEDVIKRGPREVANFVGYLPSHLKGEEEDLKRQVGYSLDHMPSEELWGFGYIIKQCSLEE